MAGSLAVLSCASSLASAEPGEPSWLYDGCAIVRGGADHKPVCLVDANPRSALVLWTRAATCSQLTLRGARSSISSAVAGGCQHKVTIADLPARGTVVVAAPPLSGPSFSLNVEILPAASLMHRQVQAAAQSRADLATLTSELGHKCPAAPEPLDCRLAMAMAQWRGGDPDGAQMTYREVLEEATKAGATSIAFESAIRLAELLRESGLLTDALNQFHKAHELASPGFARDEILFSFYWARYLRDVKQMPEVSRWLRSAMADAERVDHRDAMRLATMSLIRNLFALGQTQQATQMLTPPAVAQLLDGADDCKQAELRPYLGWLLSNARDATGRASEQSLTDIFTAALPYRERCPDSRYQANLYLGLAYAAYLENQSAVARSWLDKARSTPGAYAEDQLELVELQARVSLQERDPHGALARFQELEQVSRVNNPQVKRWFFQCHAALGQMEALHALGQRDSAAAFLQTVQQCVQNPAGTLTQVELQQVQRRALALGLAVNAAEQDGRL